ncbi:MAG: hypothetical protein A2599_03390 [Candidatus Staskawiczbacteria bacterium RIFOXYD1_FULL_39_28]|nr:MAG: hypothetical protein A2599_03390 [Candidatus Staskawiczbacteria bacterium RIFOXYD1_FULL_39_28]
MGFFILYAKINKYFSKMNKQKGFTVIELIVVIAIIGVLATVVIGSVVVYIGKAEDSQVKANVSQAAKQLQIYYSENNSFSGLSLAEDGFQYLASPSSNKFIVWQELSNGQVYVQNYTGATSTLNNFTDTGDEETRYEIQEGEIVSCTTVANCDPGACSCTDGECIFCEVGYHCEGNISCVENAVLSCQGTHDVCSTYIYPDNCTNHICSWQAVAAAYCTDIACADEASCIGANIAYCDNGACVDQASCEGADNGYCDDVDCTNQNDCETGTMCNDYTPSVWHPSTNCASIWRYSTNCASTWNPAVQDSCYGSPHDCQQWECDGSYFGCANQ